MYLRILHHKATAEVPERQQKEAPKTVELIRRAEEFQKRENALFEVSARSADENPLLATKTLRHKEEEKK